MKITRRKLRNLLLREIKHLNESGMGDVEYDIQEEIVDYLKQGYDNNIDSVVNHIMLEFPDYFFNFSHCKSAIIEILSYSSMLKYSRRFRAVGIRDEYIDMNGINEGIGAGRKYPPEFYDPSGKLHVEPYDRRAVTAYRQYLEREHIPQIADIMARLPGAGPAGELRAVRKEHDEFLETLNLPDYKAREIKNRTIAKAGYK